MVDQVSLVVFRLLGIAFVSIPFFLIIFSVPPSRWIEAVEETVSDGKKVSIGRVSVLGALFIAFLLCIYNVMFAAAAVDIEIIDSLLLYSVGNYTVNKGRSALKERTQSGK